MNSNVLDIFNELVREKNLDRATVHNMVEAGLAAAARKKYGAQADVVVRIEEGSNSISIALRKQVTDEVLDRVVEISVKDAGQYNQDAVVGDVIEVPVEFASFGRNAILAAKQVVIQKVREAERERVLKEYSGRIGEIISGSIQQIERGNFIIFIDKSTEAIIPQREQVRREHYRQGDLIRACLLDVQDTSRGPQLILSRASPEFVKALFKLEVPEVSQGIVEIRGISREPGSRTKIAVQSHDMNVDAVGACVGLKGSRVQAIVSELGGERIDIVPFSEDGNIYVRRALSPSSVTRTIPDEEERKMTVIVAEDQLSLAIGRAGQNVRLASKLTGWEIDLLTSKEYEEREARKEEGEMISLEDYELTRIPGIGTRTANQLSEAGYRTLADLLNVDKDELLEVPGIGNKTADKLIAIITNLSDELAIDDEEESEETVESETEETLLDTDSDEIGEEGDVGVEESGEMMVEDEEKSEEVVEVEEEVVEEEDWGVGTAGGGKDEEDGGEGEIVEEVEIGDGEELEEEKRDTTKTG